MTERTGAKQRVPEASLLHEDVSARTGCAFCEEAPLHPGAHTSYGAIVIYHIGDASDGWFATLSPKTGGDAGRGFTVQLMPLAHLTHFAQVAGTRALAANYGIAFARLSRAMTEVVAAAGGGPITGVSDTRDEGLALAAYGKCTTWKEKKEHLHLKLFPFRGAHGQPFTVDSSFLRKEVFTDPASGEEFVKMKPVRKKAIAPERLVLLAEQLMRAACA